MISAEAVWRQSYRHPTPWESAFPALSMVELFERSAHAAGKAPLIDFLGRHFSYAETLDGA
ncbi:hypothetical protein, partial [Pseudomonas sp. EA_65y_Pfl1_P113]